MSSFYTQQLQTPGFAILLANQNQSHFMGPQYNLWGGWQQPTPVHSAPAHGYALVSRELPADWIATRHLLPSTSRRVSKPPTNPEVPAEATKTIAPEPIQSEEDSMTQLAPPRFCPQLSDPAFLLEEDQPKVVQIAPKMKSTFSWGVVGQNRELSPPKMERELSDPSFLLEPEKPKPVAESQPEPEQNADPKDAGILVEVTDEWFYDESEPLTFEHERGCDGNDVQLRNRSKSCDSGSSFSSESMFKHSEPVFEKDNKRTNLRVLRKPIPGSRAFISDIQTSSVQKKRQTVQIPKPADNPYQIYVVKKRRKPKKTIKPGNVYQTKRSVKVTYAEDPSYYGKPKRSKERDPNEIWTVRDGIRMEVVEVQGNRAYICCTVEFWSKHQLKTQAPRRKRVEGWITLKDREGWVL